MRMRYRLSNQLEPYFTLEYIVRMIALMGLTSFLLESWFFFDVRTFGIHTNVDEWIRYAWVVFVGFELLLFSLWEEKEVEQFKSEVYQSEVRTFLKKEGFFK